MTFSKPLVQLVPDYPGLVYLMAQQLGVEHNLIHQIFPVATVTKLLTTYQLFTADESNRDRPFTLVIAGSEIEAVAEGRWFEGLNFLLSAPDTEFHVHIVGPNIRCQEVRGLKGAFSQVPEFPDCQVQVSLHECSLHEFLRALGASLNIDAVIMLHPGFEKHSEEWGQDKGLHALLADGVNVVGTSYGTTEFHIDERFARAQGFHLAEQLINPLRLNFAGDEYLDQLTSFGGTLWRMRACEPDLSALKGFSLDDDALFEEIDAPVATGEFKTFTQGESLPVGAALNEAIGQDPGAVRSLSVLKSLNIHYDRDIARAYPDYAATAMISEGINIFRRHCAGLSAKDAEAVAQLQQGQNDYITSDYAKRYGLDDHAYAALSRIVIDCLGPALDVSVPFAQIRSAFQRDGATDSFNQGGFFNEMTQMTVSNLEFYEQLNGGDAPTITAEGRVMSSMAGVVIGAKALGLSDGAIAHAIRDSISTLLFPDN